MKKVMSTCAGLNFVQSINSCLVALTNPDVALSWVKFCSSLDATTSEIQFQQIRGGLL